MARSVKKRGVIDSAAEWAARAYDRLGEPAFPPKKQRDMLPSHDDTAKAGRTYVVTQGDVDKRLSGGDDTKLTKLTDAFFKKPLGGTDASPPRRR